MKSSSGSKFLPEKEKALQWRAFFVFQKVA
jgi:hypothetical protein